mmetsp:Transcript_26480/g.50293  ORF Transcript_26480/g.50293 Transcript_26480/m.50293 type:complete len:266 (+) Transcript_26480:363-1160(+)
MVEPVALTLKRHLPLTDLTNKNITQYHHMAIILSELLRSATVEVNKIPQTGDTKELLDLIGNTKHEDKDIFTSTRPLEIIRTRTTEQSSGYKKLKITLPSVQTAHTLHNRILTTAAGIKLNIVHDSGFIKDYHTGTYAVCYNPQDPRNLNLARDTHLAEIAKKALGDYMDFPFTDRHTNLQNTQTFMWAGLDRIIARWSQWKSEAPGKPSYFEFEYPGEDNMLSLCMTSDTYKMITTSAQGQGGGTLQPRGEQAWTYAQMARPRL